MTTKASSIFNFVRGALRGFYGIEDFRNKSVLIIGMSETGQELLNGLCIEGVNLLFKERRIRNYGRSFAICRDIETYDGQIVDITINLEEGFILMGNKSFPIDKINDNPYVQGIHEFYL